MSDLEIRVEPDPILREVCRTAILDERTARLVEGMVRSMERAQGIGLAAPQVGLAERLFVTHAPHDRVRVFANPAILSLSAERVELQEGCLSIPGMYEMVSRPRDVTVQAYDQYGQAFVLEVTGMVARVILHEYDHLEGVLFWDHVAEAKRRKLQRQYRRGGGGSQSRKGGSQSRKGGSQ